MVCVSYTITSFKEMPLDLVELRSSLDEPNEEENLDTQNEQNYGSLEMEESQVGLTRFFPGFDFWVLGGGQSLRFDQ